MLGVICEQVRRHGAKAGRARQTCGVDRLGGQQDQRIVVNCFHLLGVNGLLMSCAPTEECPAKYTPLVEWEEVPQAIPRSPTARYEPSTRYEILIPNTAPPRHASRTRLGITP